MAHHIRRHMKALTILIFAAIATGLLFGLMLTGCSGVSVRNPVVTTSPIQGARDATKAAVDFLCPAPVVPDPRGSFEAGFFTRYMANRQATQLSQQDVADIEAFKMVCNKGLADRSDFDYGTLAGGAVDRITVMLLPSMGKDFFSIMSALGLVIR
jgi:hypothetical protein